MALFGFIAQLRQDVLDTHPIVFVIFVIVMGWALYFESKDGGGGA